MHSCSNLRVGVEVDSTDNASVLAHDDVRDTLGLGLTEGASAAVGVRSRCAKKRSQDTY